MTEPLLQSQADDDWRETRDAWFLVGPTAAGKTQVGLELAERIGAEILSLDSMALFRGLDVGTAKPTAAERARVPHHLIDILEPNQDFSLAEYVRAAAKACRLIRSRGRTPLFVGGTPLYLKALLRGIFQGPEPDWTLRNQLEAEGAAHEPGYLHARLAEIDPAAAARLHITDTRRIIRAIEVFTKTGRTISELQQQFDRARASDACHVGWLDWPRDQLYARINRRVEQMFADGLVEEVQRLIAKVQAVDPSQTSKVRSADQSETDGGDSADRSSTQEDTAAASRVRSADQSELCRVRSADRSLTSKSKQTSEPGSASTAEQSETTTDRSSEIVSETVFSRTALQAVGYREVLEMLDGKQNLATTIELVQNRTRAFARRQHTWLRSLSECRIVSLCEPLDPREVAERIMTMNKAQIKGHPH